MRADDRVRAHDAVFDRGQVHRAALAAHQAIVALHQLAQHLLDRDAAGERVGVAAIGAERKIAGLHRAGEARRHRFLAQRQMASALHQILQEQVIGALLGFAEHDLRPVHGQPHFFADVVIDARLGTDGRARGHGAHSGNLEFGPIRPRQHATGREISLSFDGEATPQQQ